MSQIHILDKYNFEVKEVLSNKQENKVVLEDTHTRNIENHSETYDFIVDYRASEQLENRDRVLIPDEVKEYYREFIINKIETDTYDGETEVFTEASYLEDLQKAKPIAPQKLEQATPKEAVEFALRGTGWEVGDVEYAGFRTISWTSYNSPYEVLKIFATRFESQLDFTIETRANKVTKRLVHLRQPKNLFNGKEIRRGKDLADLKRTTLSTDVVTALVALAPEPDEGEERLVIEIKDDEAQAKWGKAYNYIWGVYEPESQDTEMTEARLRTLATTELNKHNKPKVEYQIEAISIEEQFPHEKVLIGDKIRLKDDLSEPFFYVDATVKEVSRSIFDKHSKSYTLGEITEHQREDLRKHFNALLGALRQRLSETNSNLDNIVTIIDKEVERRIHKGETPPDNPLNDQLWLDTSNPDKPILKRYFDGEWHTEIKAVTEAEDIGAITREQAMYEAVLSSFENLKATHEQLLTEALIIKENQYINQTHTDNINAKLQVVIDAYNLLSNEIAKHTDTSKITLEESNHIHQLMLDYSAAVSELRAAITNATDFAMAHLAYLQSQYTDEKYNEAMSEVAETFGLAYEDGVLTGDAVLMSDLVSTKEDLQEQLKTTKNTLNDMIEEITGDSRNMIIGTSLIDPTHFAVQGGHTILDDEPLEYVRIHKDRESGDYGTNLYIGSSSTDGKRLHLDGTETVDNAHTVSDFITVSPSSFYTWRSNTVIEHPRIIFYDDEKQYLEGMLFESHTNINFETPMNTKYIKVTAPTDKIDDSTWAVEKGYTFPSDDSLDEAYIMFLNKMDYIAGETYTLALDFRSSVVDELDYIFLSNDSTTHIIHETSTPIPFNLKTDSKWNRYYMQFTPTKNIPQAQLKVGTDFTGDTIGDFDVRQIHLYKGTSEMAWQPAPEDNRQYITQLSREITDLEYKISTKLTRDDYDILNGEITSLNTEVSQTAEALVEKADKSVVDTINETVENHETKITTHAEGIETLITKTTTHDEDITKVTNTANETAEGLKQTITKVTDAEGAISRAQADIKANTEEISNKLSTAKYTTDKDGIISSLEAANSERTQLAKEIRDKVTLTDYESYKASTGTLGDANKNIYIEADNKGKWLRLAMNTGDRAFGRFIIADKTSSQHGTVEFNASVLYNRVQNAEFVVNSFSKMTSFPFTKARFLTKDTYDEQYLDLYFDPTRDTTNNISIWLKDNIQQTGWKLQELNESTLPSGYTTTEFEINETASTKGVLTKHETSIEQNGEAISLKAEQSELDSVNKTLSQKQAELELTAEKIEGNVSGLSDDLTEVSTKVTQNKEAFDVTVTENNTRFSNVGTELAEKVGQKEVVASINASREGIKISGDMVDISAGSSIRLAIDDTKTYANETAKTAESNAKAYADEEVSKVIVNGRNLYVRSSKHEKTRIYLDGTVEKDNYHTSSDFIPVLPSTDYIWHTHNSHIEAPRVIFYDNKKNYQEGKLYEDDWYIKFTTPESAYFIRVTAPTDIVNESTWMVEKGSIPSTHSEAPEDAKARVDATLAEIKEVSEALGTFETTINESFRDGVIEEAEAKAIKSHKVQLSKEKADLDQKKDIIYSNSKLSGTAKKNLQDAKAVYNNAHADLINSIDSAIKDNKATTAEYNNVTKKFGVYEDKLAQLTLRLEEANDFISTSKSDVAEGNAKRYADTTSADAEKAAKAHADAKAEAERVIAEAHADNIVTAEEKARIAEAKAKLAEAKEHAETKAEEAERAAKAVANTAQNSANSAMSKATAAGGVADTANTKIDKLKVGTRNLLLKSGEPVTTRNYNIQDYYLTEDIPEGTEVTVSFKAKLATGKSYFRMYNSGGSVSMGKNFVPTKEGEFEVFTHTFYWNVGTSNNTFLRIYHMPSATSEFSTIEWIKLEHGNRATGWAQAPEDIVEKDKVITEINLDKSGVKIQGDKVDITAGTSIRLAIDDAAESVLDAASKDATSKANTAEKAAKLEAAKAQETANSARSVAEEAKQTIESDEFMTVKSNYHNDTNIASKDTGKWLRIASNTGSRAHGRFILRDTTSAQHGVAVFEAGINYGANPYINLTSYGRYSQRSFTKARIVHKSTYDQVYLEIYINESDRTQNLAYWLTDNIQSTGWAGLDWTDGGVPSSYTTFNKELNEDTVVSQVADTAKKIADSKVAPNEVIPSINLDKSGVRIEGNRIDLSAGSAVKVAIDAAEKNAKTHAQDNLDNLQIGGANLIPKTDFHDYINPPAGWIRWGTGGYINNRVQWSDYILVQNDAMTGTFGFTSDSLIEEVAEGQTYTLSYKASPSAQAGAMDYNYLMNVDGNNQRFPAPTKKFVGNIGNNAVYEYTTTIIANFSGEAYVLIGSQTLKQGIYGYIYMSKPQLEVGSKATAWSRADRDSVAKHKIISEINLDKSGTKISGDMVDIKANDINLTANNQFKVVVGEVEDALADAKKAQSTADSARSTANAAVPKNRVISAIEASNESMKISADKLALIGGKSITVRLNNADNAASKAHSAANVAQGTAEGAIEDLNNLDFSGTNMLQHTNFRDQRNIDKMGAPWGTGSRYYQSVEDYLLVSTNSSGSQIGMRTMEDELLFEPNQEYTLSFKAYSSGYTDSEFNYVYIYRPDGRNEGSFPTTRTKLGKAPQTSYDLYEYKVTFKSKVDHDIPAQMLIADTTSGSGYSTWVRIKDIMLQKGNRATPYQLHPSEVVEKRSIVSEINLNDQGAKIQGDKIKLVAGDEISLEIANARKEVINSNVANNNLIGNTDMWNNSDRFYDNHSITAATTSGIIGNPPFGKGWFRMVRSDGDLSYIWTHNAGRNRFGVAAGKTYTFSILVAQNYMGNDLNYIYMRRVSDSRQIRLNDYLVEKVRVGEVWGRYVYKYVYTFDSPFTSVGDTVMFFGFSNASENRAGYYLSEWKLEEGTEATAYTEQYATKQDLISQINMDDSGVSIQGNQIDITGNTTFRSTQSRADGAHTTAWNAWNRTESYESGGRSIDPRVMSNWGMTSISGGRIQTDQMVAKRVDIVRPDAYTSGGKEYGIHMDNGLPNMSLDVQRNKWLQGGNMVEDHGQGYMYYNDKMASGATYSCETIYTSHHSRYMTVGIGYDLNGNSTSIYAIGQLVSFGDGNYGTVTSRQFVRNGETAWDNITIDLGVPDYSTRLAFYLRFGTAATHHTNTLKVRINRVHMWG